MAQKLTERFEMRLTVDGVARLDGWRRVQPDIPSRAEAIRRLVEIGLCRETERGQASPPVSLDGEDGLIFDRGGFFYNEGSAAAAAGLSVNDNPYISPVAHDLWLSGYRQWVERKLRNEEG